MEQGTCPKCGSGELDYAKAIANTNEGSVAYPFKCSDCGFEGFEVYYITFDRYTNKDHTEIQ